MPSELIRPTDETVRQLRNSDLPHDMTTLDITFFRNLENLDALAECKSLERIYMEGCLSLENVDGLRGCANLRIVDLDGCDSLKSIEGLADARNLEEIYLTNCYNINSVDVLAECVSLKHIHLRGCKGLPRPLRKNFHSYAKFRRARNGEIG